MTNTQKITSLAHEAVAIICQTIISSKNVPADAKSADIFARGMIKDVLETYLLRNKAISKSRYRPSEHMYESLELARKWEDANTVRGAFVWDTDDNSYLLENTTNTMAIYAACELLTAGQALEAATWLKSNLSKISSVESAVAWGRDVDEPAVEAPEWSSYKIGEMSYDEPADDLVTDEIYGGDF